MSIQVPVLLAVAAFFLILIVVIVFLASRRRSIVMDPSATLERIAHRLDQLESLSGGVESLSQLFLVPHARGGLGETLLAELLRSWLPSGAYGLQHSFGDGSRVDAVVRLGKYLVPIDAKFPLESIRRSMEKPDRKDVVTPEVRRAFLKHVADISAKYIKPAEGTLQFALMYVPSERVYYHAFVESDSGLLEEALHAGVVPVGPGSLFLYLQTVAYGLRGMSFSEKQKVIMQLLGRLRVDFRDFSKAFSVAAGHQRNLAKSFDEAQRKLSSVDDSVSALEDVESRTDGQHNR